MIDKYAKIKEEYLTSNKTLKELCLEHGLPYSTVWKVKQKQSWDTQSQHTNDLYTIDQSQLGLGAAPPILPSLCNDLSSEPECPSWGDMKELGKSAQIIHKKLREQLDKKSVSTSDLRYITATL